MPKSKVKVKVLEKVKEKIEANPIKVKQDAIDSILEKGVDFTITVQNKSIFNKLRLAPIKRTFVIYPINMGTMFKISEILLDLDTEELLGVMKNNGNDKGKDVNILDLGAKNIIENKDKLIKMIAYGIVNSEKEPSKSLIRFLNENLTAKEGLKIMNLVIRQMDVSPFLVSLMSIKGMNLLQKIKETIPGD